MTESNLTAAALPGEASNDLPLHMDADFAPLRELETEARSNGVADDPFLQDSLDAQQAFEQAVQAAAAGNEAAAIQQYLKASKLAETAHEWHLAAVSCQRVGDFLSHPKPPFDLERAIRMYHRAVSSYYQCGLYTEARRLAYKLSWTQLYRARELRLPLVQRVELAIYWALSGFGHRPLRVIGTAIALIVVYACLYWGLAGITAPGKHQDLDFGQALYFSGMTFTTVGYGDFVPAPHARFLAMSEGFLGAFLIGFFVVVVSNRLRH